MARRIARVFSTLVVAAGLLFGALLVLPAALGWQRYVIVSGSMTGTYDRGSLVLDEVVPVSELREGDVITYRPPAGSGPAGLVTHRIAEVTTDKQFDQYIRETGYTVHHPVGTCRMGSDNGAVVDPQLRVNGIKGLRIADASVMPSIIGGNTNAPTVMIGERGARMILSSY